MSNRQARILFVEDDIGKRYVIARQLRQVGFEIDEAETGEQGLRMIRPDHDVAILDIKLPDMYGWDVCERIKANPQTADVKVLELSATLASAQDRARGLEQGADCYLVHPVEMVELIAALRALIRLRSAERDRIRAQELLLATLGHDLRNPLNVISTGLSVLTESPAIAGTDRDVIVRIDRTVDRMRRMVDQLMVFAQTLGGEVVPVSPAKIDLGELVKHVVSEARQTTKKPCEAESTLEQPIIGDQDKLTRVFENLVVNALNHGDGSVHARVSRDEDHAIVAIHNGGLAIPPESLANLFDPFTRTRRSTGVGLGLYIVDQIVRAHSGTVTVASTAEAGTTFTVRLPLATA